VVAYTVAALAPNMDVANAALPTYTVTLLFFSGAVACVAFLNFQPSDAPAVNVRLRLYVS
jgi:hypothetical protein